MADIVIRNGSIVDGTLAPAFTGDSEPNLHPLSQPLFGPSFADQLELPASVPERDVFCVQSP